MIVTISSPSQIPPTFKGRGLYRSCTTRGRSLGGEQRVMPTTPSKPKLARPWSTYQKVKVRMNACCKPLDFEAAHYAALLWQWLADTLLFKKHCPPRSYFHSGEAACYDGQGTGPERSGFESLLLPLLVGGL